MLKNIITNIAPDKSEKEINSVISKLWKSNSINTRNTDNILKEQLSEYFLKNLGQNYQREIKASIKDILSPTKDLIKYTKIFNANISNNSQKADEAKRLYKLGIAQFEVAKHLLELEGYVENFYDEYKPMELTLNPHITPAQNAQSYFKKYNKLKNTISACSINGNFEP